MEKSRVEENQNKWLNSIKDIVGCKCYMFKHVLYFMESSTLDQVSMCK